MDIRYPEYGNSIANLACSVLKYYGIDPPNPTLPIADRLFTKEFKNVVVLLLDGMGSSSVEEHLAGDGFFRSNMIASYSSVFPPTTVAATTSIDCGLYPNQHCWLGWTGYFKELDRNIIYFLNKDSDTGEIVADFHAAFALLPYQNIRDMIAETGVDVHYIAPFTPPNPKRYGAFCEEIKRVCELDGKKYIYAYWDEPDKTMHNHGVNCKKVHDLLLYIESLTETLCEQLKDTLVIITADHGHINVNTNVITDYPNIADCLIRMPSIESRALNLFVKDGMEERLKAAFREHFGDGYMLLSKAEVLEKQLFGIGINHPKLHEMLGDYLAIAIDSNTIANYQRMMHLGNHAGLTTSEMMIPFIAITT